MQKSLKVDDGSKPAANEIEESIYGVRGEDLY